jgi:hypothetical protein
MRVVQMKPVSMFSNVWLPQKSSKRAVDSGCRKYEALYPAVVLATAQSSLQRCPSPGASFSYLPQYPWRLFLTAFTSSPKIISRWFSFEQPQYFHSKYTEHTQWEESVRVRQRLS